MPSPVVNHVLYNISLPPPPPFRKKLCKFMAFLGVVVSVLAFMKPVVNAVILISVTIPASIMIVMEMRRWVGISPEPCHVFLWVEIIASFPGLLTFSRFFFFFFFSTGDKATETTHTTAIIIP